jgi:hypothetical protein
MPWIWRGMAACQVPLFLVCAIGGAVLTALQYFIGTMRHVMRKITRMTTEKDPKKRP